MRRSESVTKSHSGNFHDYTWVQFERPTGNLAGCDTWRPSGRVRPYGSDRQHRYSRLRADGADVRFWG